MTARSFGYTSRVCRLHADMDAIGAHLASEVSRSRAKRAFVVSSPSVVANTDVVERISTALGDRYAGVFGGIEKDTTFASVTAACERARESGPDMILAVGGGSVVVAGRAAAIFLGENGDPFELMTQYSDSRRAVSPRLNAAKMPIINIPATPTAAINRAGVGLKNPDLDHRMEYFDPKTRPVAILLDGALLSSTPTDVLRSTATTAFCAGLAAVATTGANRIAEGDRLQGFRLALRAYRRLAERGEIDTDGRFDLAVAAFLQNRAEDADGRVVRTGAFAGNYAVSTALHIRFPHVGQGEATSVLASAVMRTAEDPVLAEAQRVAEALGLREFGESTQDLTRRVAASVDALLRAAGAPIRLCELNIAREALDGVAAETVKNFNFNSGAVSAEETVRRSRELLEAAWE